MNIDGNDFWVFAYGSLMWNPGFPFVEKAAGRVYGYHRSLCVTSTIYRGTPEKPGLVMGLDQGGSCTGLAFKVAPRHVNETLSYLEEREQVINVYTPHLLETRLDDGRTVCGYTFVVRRDHDNYAGKLSTEEQARLVAQGVGPKGTALEYVANTVGHMDTFGIKNSEMHNVLKRAAALKA